MFVVVELIAPMEESCNAEFIYLHADDPGAGRGHGKIAVGDIQILVAAVVCPQVGYLVFQEGIQMVAGGDGAGGGSGGVKIVVR